MDTSSWIGLVSVIVTVVIFLIGIWLNKTYRQKDSIKRFPPLNKKWAKPFFRLSSTDKKSISRFIGFFNQVDNELVELDLVVEDDALVNVSREMLENENVLASNYLTIWEPYAKLTEGVANSSNSTGFAIHIIYDENSDASLFYQHGCWYLKGFFTVLPGFTNQGICEISLRAERVQSRRL